ncbi:hypothetical protein FACS1894152_8240 [Bacilli bacterium]|nr:hypothetical protein FACS1894152_8240 [Bacilli bacterium]GHU33854.1 hypothetical protein FACS1894166_10280 [Bacilli bacterium]
MIKTAMKTFYPSNMGGTAVGTGFEAPKGYDKYCVAAMNKIMKCNHLTPTPNKYHGC